MERPNALGQLCQESFGVRFDLESRHDVIRKPDDDDVASGVLLAPCLDPEVKHVVEIDVRQLRRYHAPNAKGNFQFERVVVGWRSRAVLDLRRK